MATGICIHHVKEIRVKAHNRDNSNSLLLEFQHADNFGKPETLELQTFNLPKVITDKLLLAFGDEATRDYAEQESEAA